MNDYLPIPGYVGVYWINRAGDVRNAHGKQLKPTFDRSGKKRYTLRSNGRRDCFIASYLVAVSFHSI